MKEYSAMSDFEINKSVAQTLGAKPYLSDSGDFEKSISYGDEAVIISSEFKLGAFDPCNSWADPGPIIANNRIELFNADSERMVWLAQSPKNRGDFAIHENPLRVAMIVFLMMKDAENGN